MTTIYRDPNTNISEIAFRLGKGDIGVMISDTVWGIFTSALNPRSVEKIYKLKKRSEDKPFIVLISSLTDLRQFGIVISQTQKKILESIWPNPISVILECDNNQLLFLHRGQNSLAFRIPKLDWLQKIINISGPLVAPSANLAGDKPVNSFTQAKRLFNNQVDFYVKDGESNSQPSTLVKLTNRSVELLREGCFKLDYERLKISKSA